MSSIGDESLDYWLNHFCDRTKNVVEGADSFAPTVLVISSRELVYKVLVHSEDADEDGLARLRRFQDFGRMLKSEHAAADFILVSEALESSAGPIMVLHGCSQHGETAQRGFQMSFGSKRRLHVGQDVSLGGTCGEYNPASEVFTGLRDK